MGHKRLGRILTQGHLNDLAESLEMQTVMQHGRGVLEGCHLSARDESGFRIRCDRGIVCAEASSRVPFDDDIFAFPSGETYVWRSETGQSLTTKTPVPIGGLFVCVGRVVANAHSIEFCDGTGRMEPARMNPEKPNQFVARCELLPKGPVHHAVSERFTDDDIVLTPEDRNIQMVDPGTNNVRIFLFDDPHFGNWFRVGNIAQYHGGTVSVVHGNTEIRELAPGDIAEFGVMQIPENRGKAKPMNAESRKAARYKNRARNAWICIYCRSILS